MIQRRSNAAGVELWLARPSSALRTVDAPDSKPDSANGASETVRAWSGPDKLLLEETPALQAVSH